MKNEIISQIEEHVREIFGLTKEQFFTKLSSARNVVDARYLFYLVCSMRNIKIFYIEKYMLENDHYTTHSNISHGIKVMKKRYSDDDDYIAIVNRIQQKVII
jgi:hypothetical protein